jgi:hypothetical protein
MPTLSRAQPHICRWVSFSPMTYYFPSPSLSSLCYKLALPLHAASCCSTAESLSRGSLPTSLVVLSAIWRLEFLGRRLVVLGLLRRLLFMSSHCCSSTQLQRCGRHNQQLHVAPPTHDVDGLSLSHGSCLLKSPLVQRLLHVHSCLFSLRSS